MILGKKKDFAAYGISVKFDDSALELLAEQAHEENTGARGLVNAVEKALLLFETQLPSTSFTKFPVTSAVIENPEKAFSDLFSGSPDAVEACYRALHEKEVDQAETYIMENRHKFSGNHRFNLTPRRARLVARYYSKSHIYIEHAADKIRHCYEDLKILEMQFFKNYGINVILEEEASDFIVDKLAIEDVGMDDIIKEFNSDFELGLKLVREKTDRNRFFITRDALTDPESYISRLLTEINRENPAGKTAKLPSQ